MWPAQRLPSVKLFTAAGGSVAPFFRRTLYATSTPHRFFSCSDLRLIYGPSNELTEEYPTSS
ncbi:hypothetical protein CN072_32505, partial [Sinorhizobium meliloti]